MSSVLTKEKHIQYLKRFLYYIPGKLAEQDASRMTIAFFALSGLDLLDGLHILNTEQREHIINWIYSLQILPKEDDETMEGGFRGSSFIITRSTKDSKQSNEATNLFDSSHIAMTYTALLSLLILGDDLNKVNKKAVINHLSSLQNSDGSFQGSKGNESDMRFVYCASTISYVLKDWSGINKQSLKDFIYKSWTYEGAIGQTPDSEGHGGPTFCALASLFLMDEMTLSDEKLKALVHWCMHRQKYGFQGRPNKPADTCYAFWIGATLKLVNKFHLVDEKSTRDFILSTQDDTMGGLAKMSDAIPDPLHTYFGLGGLSLLGEDQLNALNPALNISERAASHLHNLQQSWL